ncbi:Holliday junction branch migration protein RuvA [Myxococcota bacterium]|nr:Holliday junction branch migration protein RuvA [Myxococcota bacterium]
MIGFLKGTLRSSESSGEIVIDVQGVGYEVFVDAQTWASLGAVGSPVQVFVRTVVREDAITLYGFPDATTRLVFDLLTGVSGIGPRMALAVLGGMPLPELVEAVRTRNLKRLCQINGVGKRTAERLCLELQEKFLALPVEGPGRPQGLSQALYEDARSALLNLGFPSREVEDALRKVPPGNWTLESLVKAVLGQLTVR